MVIVPVVLCGLMMGFGVWAVILGADAQVDSERCVKGGQGPSGHTEGGHAPTSVCVVCVLCRREAQSQAEAAASALQLTVERAVLPITFVVDWVKNTGSYSVIRQNWPARVQPWMAPVRRGAARDVAQASWSQHEARRCGRPQTAPPASHGCHAQGYEIQLNLGPQGWFPDELRYPAMGVVTWNALTNGSVARTQVRHTKIRALRGWLIQPRGGNSCFEPHPCRA